MTIKIDQRFTNFTTATPEYPFGAAKNETIPRQSNDGTTVQAVFINDNYGYICAVLAEAGIEPSDQPDNALVSDVLKAQKTIFMPQLIDGGDWSNVAGSQITRLNSRQFWLFEGESYVVSPSVTNFPITAPDDPTTQPSIYIKARFITRSEFDVFKALIESDLDDIRKDYLKLSGGTLTGFLSLYGSPSLNFGIDDNDRYKFSFLNETKQLTLAYRSQSGWQNIFKSNPDGTTVFPVSPLIGSKVVATQEYADTQSQSALESANEYTDEQAAIVIKKAVPVGSLVDFAIEKDRDGYLRCDGSAHPIASYPELGAELGDFFNHSADPVNVFRVPTLPISVGGGSGEPTYEKTIPFSSEPYGLLGFTFDNIDYLCVLSRQGGYVYETRNTSFPVYTIGGMRDPVDACVYKKGDSTFMAVADAYGNTGNSNIKIFTINHESATYVQTISAPSERETLSVATYTLNETLFLISADKRPIPNGTRGRLVLWNMNDEPSIFNIITNDYFVQPSGVTSYQSGNDTFVVVADNKAGSGAWGQIQVYNVLDFSKPVHLIGNNGSSPHPYSITSYKIKGIQYIAVSFVNESYSQSFFRIYNVDDNFRVVNTVSSNKHTSIRGISSFIENRNIKLALADYPSRSIVAYNLDSTIDFQIVPYIKA